MKRMIRNLYTSDYQRNMIELDCAEVKVIPCAEGKELVDRWVALGLIVVLLKLLSIWH